MAKAIFNVDINIAQMGHGIWIGSIDLHMVVGKTVRRWVQVQKRVHKSEETAREDIAERAFRLAVMIREGIRDGADFFYDESYQWAEPFMVVRDGKMVDGRIEILTQVKEHTMAHLEALAENLDMPRDLTERTIGEKIAKEMLAFTGKITSWRDAAFGEGIIIDAENGTWRVWTIYDSGELAWDKIDRFDS